MIIMAYAIINKHFIAFSIQLFYITYYFYLKLCTQYSKLVITFESAIKYIKES